VKITTKKTLTKLNGAAAPALIARTADHIFYRQGRPALVLIDVDTKGMPETVRQRIEALGGFWPALVSVLPVLGTARSVIRRSTSAGLSRTDTGADISDRTASIPTSSQRTAPTPNASCVPCTKLVGSPDLAG
jgi:hypothetical protein